MKKDSNADLQNTEKTDGVNDCAAVSNHASASVSVSAENINDSVSASCSESASFSNSNSDPSGNLSSTLPNCSAVEIDPASVCFPEFRHIHDSVAGMAGKTGSGNAAASSGDEFCCQLPKIGFWNGFLGIFRYVVPAALFMLVIVYMENPLNQYRDQSLKYVYNNVLSITVMAEKIKVIVMDGIAYPQDVVKLAGEQDRVFVRQRENLEKQIDNIMEDLKQKMYANVDPFLDNYYTLTAEYLRMFGGSFLEGLENSLMQGTENCFARLGDAQGRYREFLEKFVEAKDMILENRRIGRFDPEKHEVTGEISVEDYLRGDYGILEFAQYVQFAQFRGKASAQSAFGAVPVYYRGSKILIGGGVSQFGKINLYRKELGTKITARVLNTSVGKTASKVFGRIAAKVLTRVGTGIVGGAAVGAAGGSVVPVAGTVLGAVVGGAVTWVVTDYLMLRADEYVNRDELRSEIIKAIDKSFR